MFNLQLGNQNILQQRLLYMSIKLETRHLAKYGKTVCAAALTECAHNMQFCHIFA